MKSSYLLKHIALILSLAAPLLCSGQATRDTTLVGTYYGAATRHSFAGNAYVPPHEVSGLLFVFTLQYSNEGYHFGVISSSVLFANGRLMQVSGELVVPPFDLQQNRDLDFFFESDFVANDDRLSSNTECNPYQLYGTFPYGRYTPAYFRDAHTVPYQLAGITAFYSWVNRTQVGNTIVITSGTQTSTPFNLECEKVSEQLVYHYTPRVKIRR
jgi:hypothetical protein